MIFDLHVHTIHSPCSNLSLGEIIRDARSRGLDGVAITDHNNMNSRREIADGLQDNGICVVVGMEYDTPQGDFLLFGPFEDIEEGLSASELLQIVEDRQGAAVGAHPCRTGRSLSREILDHGACRIIEGQNGRNSDAENRMANRLTGRYPLFLCGGSDAHSLEELGQTATCFEEKITSREELIAALKSGRYRPVRNAHSRITRKHFRSRLACHNNPL